MVLRQHPAPATHRQTPQGKGLVTDSLTVRAGKPRPPIPHGLLRISVLQTQTLESGEEGSGRVTSAPGCHWEVSPGVDASEHRQFVWTGASVRLLFVGHVDTAV